MPGGIELAVIIVFIVFIFFSIKIGKFSFLKMKKIDKEISEDNNLDEFKLIEIQELDEMDIISSEDEIPLDNKHGSNSVISEHEFSKTVSNSFQLEHNMKTNLGIKTNFWTLLETQVKRNLEKSTGVEIGESITRRTKVTLEAGSGKIVKYKIIWKQKEKKGYALVMLKGKEIKIPYKMNYGLSHSVISMEL